MTTISLCMIVCNEEHNLEKCLKSARHVVDEIIIVDTGSKDNTKRIAALYDAKIIDYLWNENFSDARNASLEAANCEWVLFLDADECLDISGQEDFRKIIASADVEGYYIPIISYYNSGSGTEACKDIIFRLFRRREEYKFRGIIHEQILNSILERDCKANILIAHNLLIHHYGYLDSEVREKDKIKRNLEFLAKQLEAFPKDRYVLYQYGLELFRARRYQESTEMLKKSITGIELNGSESMYFPKLIRLLVMACYQTDRYTEAIEYARYGITMFQDYADLYYYCGLCFLELSEYGNSFEYFLKATTLGEQTYIYGSYSGVRGYKSYYYLGKICEEFDKDEEALRYYFLALKDNNGFILALEEITRILVNGEEPEDVKEALKNICDCCTADAYFTIGHILFKEKAYRLAGEYFDNAAKYGIKNEELNILWAICLGQQDRIIEAINLLDESRNSSDSVVKALYNKTFIFWLHNNYVKVRSITDVLIGLGLEKEFLTVIKMLREEAGEELVLVEIKSDATQLLFDILERAMDHGDFDKAAELLIKMDFEWIKRYSLDLAKLYLRYNKLTEVERYAYIKLTTDNEDFDALMCMGEVKSRKQDYWQAAEYYRTATAINPLRPKAYIKLLKTYDYLCIETLKSAVEQHGDIELFKTMLAKESKAV